jgi:hypothetical protein
VGFAFWLINVSSGANLPTLIGSIVNCGQTPNQAETTPSVTKRITPRSVRVLDQTELPTPLAADKVHKAVKFAEGTAKSAKRIV